MTKYDYIECGDCLKLMKDIPDKSINMILCDLPYSTTRNHWDCAIPLNDYALLNNKAVEKHQAIPQMAWTTIKHI